MSELEGWRGQDVYNLNKVLHVILAFSPSLHSPTPNMRPLSFFGPVALNIEKQDIFVDLSSV